MDVEATKAEAVDHLMTYAGISEDAAKSLVDALCDAAQFEWLGMISGGEPYPTSMSELRLLRLRYMFEAAQRRLTTQEVAVLFRITESAADTLLKRMQAVYPDAFADYLDELVRTSAHAKKSGEAPPWRYLITFDSGPAWAHAIHKLRAAGCNDLREDSWKRTIEPPREFGEEGHKQDSAKVLDIKVEE